MDCKNCSIANICIIYDTFKKYEQYADINIDNCKLNPNKAKEIMMQSVQPLKPITQDIYNRPVRDFTSISNTNKEKEKKETKKKKKTQLQVIPMEDKPNMITCPNCGAETTDDDLKPCSGCKKIVCSNCGTEDPENLEIKCDKCW